MVFGTLPLTGMTYAAEAQTCSNHAAHDDSCGFAQTVEGKPCGHPCELCDGSETINALSLGEEPARA